MKRSRGGVIIIINNRGKNEDLRIIEEVTDQRSDQITEEICSFLFIVIPSYTK